MSTEPEFLTISVQDVDGWLQSWALSQGLSWSEHPLRSRPGCRHWHVARPGQVGTLELTWCGETLQVEVFVRRNRMGAWIPSALQALREID